MAALFRESWKSPILEVARPRRSLVYIQWTKMPTAKVRQVLQYAWIQPTDLWFKVAQADDVCLLLHPWFFQGIFEVLRVLDERRFVNFVLAAVWANYHSDYLVKCCYPKR